MTEWRIDPAGVKGVVAQTRGASEELGAALAPESFDSPLGKLKWCPHPEGLTHDRRESDGHPGRADL
ncbi:hypothetical protein [Arachnia propionica]|uniref:Uncharacterized protein n=1 Tax=Arachnia propionica TaxID=1750 RepID=A0A3P1WRH0_9ACTN|nr:hypothetical protein [Arachnia propionica]RRD49204.1 hypothetical protein EII35_09485 [Arachnia propionica]